MYKRQTTGLTTKPIVEIIDRRWAVVAHQNNISEDIPKKKEYLMFKTITKVTLTALVLTIFSQSNAVSIDTANVPVKNLGVISSEIKGGGMSGQPGLPVPAVNGKQILTYTPSQGHYAGTKVKLLIATYNVDNPEVPVLLWSAGAKAAGHNTVVGLLSQYGSQQDWTPQGVSALTLTDVSHLTPMWYTINPNGDYSVGLPLGFGTAKAVKNSIVILGK